MFSNPASSGGFPGHGAWWPIVGLLQIEAFLVGGHSHLLKIFHHLPTDDDGARGGLLRHASDLVIKMVTISLTIKAVSL